jgi:hypothetical protein
MIIIRRNLTVRALASVLLLANSLSAQASLPLTPPNPTLIPAHHHHHSAGIVGGSSSGGHHWSHSAGGGTWYQQHAQSGGWIQTGGSQSQSNFQTTTSSSSNPPPLHLNLSSTTPTTTRPPVNLNLSSTAQIDAAPKFVQWHPVDIVIGTSNLVVNSSSLLTPAELLAVYQVAHTGHQSIVLGANGTAVGGSATLGPRLSANLSTLVIPQGVTVTDISRTGTLNVSGNLVDNGTLLLTTYNPTVSTFSLLASNITVGPQGLLATVQPSGVSQPLGLLISSQHDVSNEGTITTGGSLNINVGSGNLTNTGLIQSSTGSISIASTSPTQQLNVTASGGTFEAANDITLGDPTATGKADVNVIGGNFDSQTLNLYAGTGAINAATNSITGGINVTGATAVVSNTIGNLTFDSFNLSGDPIFASAGNISLPSTFFSASPGTDFIVLAGGSISGSIIIDTDDPSSGVPTAAGDIFMSAGYSFTVNGVTTPTTTVNCTSCPSSMYTTNTSVVLNPTATINVGQLIGAQVTLQAPGDIQTGVINAFLPDSTTTTPGITVTSANGNVNLPNIGATGNITVSAGQSVNTINFCVVALITLGPRPEVVQPSP